MQECRVKLFLSYRNEPEVVAILVKLPPSCDISVTVYQSALLIAEASSASKNHQENLLDCICRLSFQCSHCVCPAIAAIRY